MAFVAVLAKLSSMTLFACLEVEPGSTTAAFETIRALIFPATPRGEAAFRPPSPADFSDSYVLLEWAGVNGASSLAWPP